MSLIFAGFGILTVRQMRLSLKASQHPEYNSTERDPVMIFMSPGNYWAKLTVSDAQGNTATDIVWITVNQYNYDYDNND